VVIVIVVVVGSVYIIQKYLNVIGFIYIQILSALKLESWYLTHFPFRVLIILNTNIVNDYT